MRSIYFFNYGSGEGGSFRRKMLSFCFLGILNGAHCFAQHHTPSIATDTLVLDEVVVYGVKSAQRNNVLVPTDRVLEATQGISMIRRGNFAMEPVIRSQSNGQISVTIDGMRIFGACTDRMDPVSSYIEPNNLGSLSVSTNPGENQFGSTTGGGINFKLKDPDFSATPKINGSVGTGYDTNGNAFQAFGSVSVSRENTVFQADGIYRRSSNYRAGDGQKILFSQYEKWNGHLVWKLKTGKNSRIKADYLQDEGYNIGYPALPMDVAFAKAKIGSLAYLYRLPERNLSWETKLYYNSINHAMDDTKRPKSMVPIHMDMPGTSRTVGFYSAFSQTIGKRHHIEGRLDGFNNRLSATMTMYPENASNMFMFTLPDLARTSIGTALTDHFNLNARTNLRVAGRGEWQHDYLFSIEGKEQLSGMFEGALSRNNVVMNLSAGIDYEWTAGQKLSLDISRGSRTPTLQERYGFYIFNRSDAFDYIGNPDLKLEKSFNINPSYTYSHKSFHAVVNPFANFFQHYIIGEVLNGYSVMTSGAKGVKHYVNMKSAMMVGASLNLTWIPCENLKITSNSSIIRGSDDKRNPLPLMAPFRTSNAISYEKNDFTFFIETITNGRQNRVSSAVYGEYRTPGSTILNLHINKSFKYENQNQLKIQIGVENLLDKEYYQHLDIMKIARPGRNFSLRASFVY